MNTLDKQLADLRIYANELDAKLQDDINAAKTKPSIPPKKNKAPQPQIPQSCMVKSACEPSYSSRLEYGSRTSSTYSNLVPVKSCIVRNTARAKSGDVFLYSNLLPPGGTNHVYSNIPMQRNAESIYGDRDTRSEVSRISDVGAQSNYSELRRPGSAYPPSSASVNAQDFSTYGGSQTSSTYESLYEPINPRPCSQLSGTSLYGGYVGAVPEPLPEPDDELYCGNCFRCGGKIMGETTGCTAMERIYHIKCFCCHQCGINLQGRPFYAVQGKALCERDYLATLEKCCVCGDPILDRMLRATGKPYHPRCFTCVACHKSLDGIPFTVDAVNRIHCIEDFHKRYAPAARGAASRSCPKEAPRRQSGSSLWTRVSTSHATPARTAAPPCAPVRRAGAATRSTGTSTVESATPSAYKTCRGISTRSTIVSANKCLCSKNLLKSGSHKSMLSIYVEDYLDIEEASQIDITVFHQHNIR